MKIQTLKPRVHQLGSRLATLQPGSWRTDKMTSGQRGYDYAWQKARSAFLRRHPLCVMCLADIPSRVTPATVVDHSVAHRGNPEIFWDESKWQSLCATHHSSEAQRRDNLVK